MSRRRAPAGRASRRTRRARRPAQRTAAAPAAAVRMGKNQRCPRSRRRSACSPDCSATCPLRDILPRSTFSTCYISMTQHAEQVLDRDTTHGTTMLSRRQHLPVFKINPAETVMWRAHQMARSPSAESIGTDRQPRERARPTAVGTARAAERNACAPAQRQLQQGDELQSPTAAPAADMQTVPADDEQAQPRSARSLSAADIAAHVSSAQARESVSHPQVNTTRLPACSVVCRHRQHAINKGILLSLAS